MYCGRTDTDTTILTCTALYENKEYFFRVFAENRYGRSKPLESEIAVIPKRIFGKYICVTLFVRIELVVAKSYL